MMMFSDRYRECIYNFYKAKFANHVSPKNMNQNVCNIEMSPSRPLEELATEDSELNV